MALFTVTDDHIRIPVTLDIDLNNGFTMQTIYKAVQDVYPKDPTLSVVSINIPLLGLNCRTIGIINPITDIKNAISRLYNNLMQKVLEPIWNFLYKIYEALKKFGLGVLDLKIPVLDLHLSDLFAPDLWDRLTAKISELYNNAKDKLKKILDALKIPYPFMDGFVDPQHEIEMIIQKIANSLLSFLFNTIKKIIDLIKLGFKLYDLATPPYVLKFSITWEQIADQIWKTVLSYLEKLPTLEDIENWLKELARKIFNVKVPTCAQMVEAFKQFKIPIIGKPEVDAIVNPAVVQPCMDLQKILMDTLAWISNYIMNLLLKFVNLIVKALNAFLSLFGIKFELPHISIPMIICAVKNS
jgi:hypothetical protein